MQFTATRVLLCLATVAAAGRAHVIGDAAHDESARRLAREFRPVQVSLYLPPLAALSPSSNAPYTTASAFERFAPAVKVRTEGDFLYVESDGLPAHNMMVGITAWQQQVPLPQPYRGGNSWRIPLRPVPAPNGGVTIRDHFLRGAIALAANGIPIFKDRKSTRLNSSHVKRSRMPSSA